MRQWRVPQRGRFGLALFFIALIAAIPRWSLGSSRYIEYDGYWHVFIAQQDNWQNFWSDVYANLHPPLYFLLLKFTIWFSHSLLAYRSISLISGVLAVPLVGRIVRAATGSAPWACLAALAYGLALPSIILSCEVRSYMLSVLFVLFSFLCLLYFFMEDLPDTTRARIGFAGGAILACLSHYFAFFYVGAAVVLLVCRCAYFRYTGKAVKWKAEAATILPVLAVVYALYRSHAGRYAQIQMHLTPFYFEPGVERRSAFLLRNWENFINLFAPFPVAGHLGALAVLAAGLISGLILVVFLLRAAGAFAQRAALTISITAVMLAAIVMASLAGKYPFGGDLRQQYLLFPFLVICTAICIARLTAALSRTGRMVLAAALAIPIIWISAVRFEEYPKSSERIGEAQMREFHRMEPAPAAVYVDQFNLILFFISHDDWKWSFVKPPVPIPDVDVYQLRRGADTMLVFRDKTEWNADPDNALVYRKVSECLRGENIPAVSSFTSRQIPPKAPFPDFPDVRRTIFTQAAASSVCVAKLAVSASGWYATLGRSNCGSPFQLSGTFDDASHALDYSGEWTHGRFAPAASGTVSYSNRSGSTLSLLFRGEAITYVYSKAFNRGIADLRIDGITQQSVDLYAPQVGWQSKITLGGFAPGLHTFELTVAGRKNSAASDYYVDVDELVIR